MKMSHNRGQYTFGQLVTVVEDLKMVVETLTKEFEQYKAKIENKIGILEKQNSSQSLLEVSNIKVENTEQALDSYTEEDMTEVGCKTPEKPSEPDNSFNVHRDLLKIEKDLLESSFLESNNRKPQKQKSKKSSKKYPIVKYEEESELDVKLEPTTECEPYNKSCVPKKRENLSNSKTKEELSMNSGVKTESSVEENKRKSLRKRKNNRSKNLKYEDFDMSGTSDDSDNNSKTDDEEDEVKPKKPAKLYCKCKCPDSKDDMIACDGPCQDWYHFECVGIPDNFRSIAMWYCEECFLKETDGCVEVFITGDLSLFNH